MTNELTVLFVRRYPLNLEGSSSNRFDIPEGTPKKLAFTYRVKLPDGVTCTHCVIQWIYFAREYHIYIPLTINRTLIKTILICFLAIISK